MILGHPDVRSTNALGRFSQFILKIINASFSDVAGKCSWANIISINKKCSRYNVPDFCAVCQELHLLEHNTHWNTTIADAIIAVSPSQTLILFLIIILTWFPLNPRDLWINYKDNMTEDTLHKIRISLRNLDHGVNEDMHKQALLLIEDMCYFMCGDLLVRLAMPDRRINDAFN